MSKKKKAKLKKVLICTPAYNGQVHMSYMTSVIDVVLRGPSQGYEINIFTNTDSLITRARNNAVATFLDGDWDFLFWVDSDIAFEAGQFFRILEANRDIAAGGYPLKQLFLPEQKTKLTGRELEASMLRYAISLEGSVDVPKDGFVSVKEAATGFMCIKRAALVMMAAYYPELKYQSDQEALGAPASKNHYLLFDTMVDGGRYLSEDYAFCKRARQLNYKIWLDLNSELTHIGPYEFRGSLPTTARVNS